MADNGMIVLEGLDEFRKKIESLKTDTPGFGKRLRGAIRQILAEVRKNLQSGARAGLEMESDPRSAYKAVRFAIYKKIFGGQVNILDAKGKVTGSYYEPPRHPSRRGGNRMKQSPRTTQLMSYQGGNRGFILRFLNAGTEPRYNGGRNGTTEAQRNAFILANGGNRYRGSIKARNWFGPRSQREMQNAAGRLQEIIDRVLKDEFF